VGLGDIVLMAGGNDNSFGNMFRTFIFDTKTGSAREVASLKHPRQLAAIQIYGGKAFILGGEYHENRRSDGEMWNMDTETWEEADIHLNIGRQDFTLVAMAEEIDCN